jgi:hypothetical protein
MGEGGERHTPAAAPKRDRPGSHSTEGWVGPKTVLNGYGKSRPPPGFDPRTVQLVANRYNDYAVLKNSMNLIVTHTTFTIVLTFKNRASYI